MQYETIVVDVTAMVLPPWPRYHPSLSNAR